MCVRAVVLSLARVLGLPVYAEEEDPCGRQRTGERMDVEGEDEPKEGEEKRSIYWIRSSSYGHLHRYKLEGLFKI